MNKNLLIFFILLTSFLAKTQTLTVNPGTEVTTPGSVICVEFTVQDFNNIDAVQFTIVFDSTIILFDHTQNYNPLLPGLDEFAFNPNAFSGRVTFGWFNTNQFSIPDDEVLFEICFNVIGDIGDFSLLEFTNFPTQIEVNDGNIDFFSDNGAVFVSNTSLYISSWQENITCPGETDGKICLIIAGGTVPYTISYTNNTSGSTGSGLILNIEGDTLCIENLDEGNYDVFINDSSLPQNTAQQNIDVSPSIELSVNIAIDPNSLIQCYGDCTGAMTAHVFRGSEELPPDSLTFLWNNAQSTATINGLCSAVYSVAVTLNSDPNQCLFHDQSSLPQPNELELNFGPVTNNTCSGLNDGELTVNISGGTGSLSALWGPPLNLPFNNSSSHISGLTDGEYIVSVSDMNGCMDTASYTLTSNITLSIDETITNVVPCFGDNSGQIIVSGSSSAGGASNFNFNWIGSPTPPAPINTPSTSTLNSIAAGTYEVFMTDLINVGCQTSEEFTVTEPPELILTLINTTESTCTGGSGSATVSVEGGVEPYTYTWGITPEVNDSIATGLAPGDYILTVTDNINCSDTLHFTIATPAPPEITVLNDSVLNCAGGTDGSLSVTATPGSSAIVNYLWDPTNSGQTITGLSEGTYIVTVIDENGCIDVDSAQIISPEPVIVDSISMSLPTCPANSDGSITVFISGGTSPYTYEWSPGASSFNILAGIGAGQYYVTATDDNSCSVELGPLTLNDPPSIIATVESTQAVSCYDPNPDCMTGDGQATVSALYSDGSSGTFHFVWPSGEIENFVSSSTATLLCQGYQSVTISDGICDIVFDSIEITNPEPLTINIEDTEVTNVSCFGFSDGNITAFAQGGTPPYTYNWGVLGTGQTVDNLSPGNYTVSISDFNDCTYQHTFTITEPDVLDLSLNVLTTHDAICNGDENGVIDLEWTGGNPGSHVFLWEGGIAPTDSPTAEDLAPGTYSVTIVDEKGCEDNITHTISEPSPITFDIAQIDSIICYGGETFITVEEGSASGGHSGLYQFSVDNPITRLLGDSIYVSAGNHTVRVYDVEGCYAEETIVVYQPDEIEVIFNPQTIIVELGDSVTLQPQIIPLFSTDSVFWYPGTWLSSIDTLTPVVTPIESQNYALTVWNEKGCSGYGTVFVEVDKNRNIFIPNIFSPNNDGPNDIFKIYTGNGVKNINYVRIFNRWGGIIFEAKSLPPGDIDGIDLWDGTHHGNPVVTGVYVYAIEVSFQDGVTLLYKGDITVLR